MNDVLATYLLREQILKPDQVDDFLQLQVVMGGAFDTQVLEAKMMPEQTVLKALAEAYKMPPIGREEIDDIPQKMPDIFPRVFAETYRMIPYRLIGRNLGVVVAEKPDETAVMKLEQRLKIRIVPAITTEPRVYYAMKRLYGAEIPPRFATLLDGLDRAPEVKAPAPKVSVTADSAVAAVVAEASGTKAAVEAKREEKKSESPGKSESGERKSEKEEKTESKSETPRSEEPVFQREKGSVIPERPEAMDLDTALVRMQLAQNRDQIIDVALQFANNAFRFSGLFVLQGNSFVGYSAKGDVTSVAKMSRVTVPLILGSMFKTVHETNGHYLGVVPQSGMNAAILEDLGRVSPKIVFLAPVVIRGKLTGLLYCDNGKRGVSSRKVADLLVVITRLGPAFERLIARKKAEVKVAANIVTDAAKKAATLKSLAEADFHEPTIESVAPALPEKEHLIDDGDVGDMTLPPEPAQKAAESYNFEFQPDEPTIAITFGDGQTTQSIQPTDLLSQRFLNVLKAAEEEEEEEDEREEEEAIDFSTITADAILGKEEAPAPKPAPPPKREEPLAPITPEQVKPGFKAFAQFDDESEEEKTKGWEDVLVDIVQQGKQGGVSRKTDGPAVPSVPIEEVGWEDIIVEAQQQAHGDQADKKPRLDDMAVLLEAMDSPDEEVARRATETLWQRKEELGEKFAEMLGQRFPGRLRLDPFASGPIPPIVELSPVLRLLIAMGPQALTIVLPHLESQYPAHRLIATLFFGQVVSGHAFTKLLRRLFDDEPRIREAAADTLRKYSRLPGYDDGLARIRERLQTPGEAQARSCEILGRLRDAKAVPLLIPLTGSASQPTANTALGAMMRITAEDLGHDPAAWTQWWVKKSPAPREQWLVDGLRKEKPLLRMIADEELRLLTGLQFGFDPSAEIAAQDPAIKSWEAWWSHELRHRK